MAKKLTPEMVYQVMIYFRKTLEKGEPKFFRTTELASYIRKTYDIGVNGSMPGVLHDLGYINRQNSLFSWQLERNITYQDAKEVLAELRKRWKKYQSNQEQKESEKGLSTQEIIDKLDFIPKPTRKKEVEINGTKISAAPGTRVTVAGVTILF